MSFPLVYRSLPISSKEIELFITLNCFVSAVISYKLTRIHFLFELVAVVSYVLFVIAICPSNCSVD